MALEQLDQAAQAIIERNRIAREASSQRASRLISIIMGTTTETLEDFNDDLAARFSEALGTPVEAESFGGANGD
jgi:hypothetical protein